MMNNGKAKFAFPVGYHEFHKDKAFNFQLNRWYSMGYARFKDMEEVGQKITSFEEWKIEMLKLAEIADSEGGLLISVLVVSSLGIKLSHKPNAYQKHGINFVFNLSRYVLHE